MYRHLKKFKPVSDLFNMNFGPSMNLGPKFIFGPSGQISSKKLCLISSIGVCCITGGGIFYCNKKEQQHKNMCKDIETKIRGIKSIVETKDTYITYLECFKIFTAYNSFVNIIYTDGEDLHIIFDKLRLLVANKFIYFNMKTKEELDCNYNILFLFKQLFIYFIYSIDYDKIIIQDKIILDFNEKYSNKLDCVENMLKCYLKDIYTFNKKHNIIPDFVVLYVLHNYLNYFFNIYCHPNFTLDYFERGRFYDNEFHTNEFISVVDTIIKDFLIKNKDNIIYTDTHIVISNEKEGFVINIPKYIHPKFCATDTLSYFYSKYISRLKNEAQC